MNIHSQPALLYSVLNTKLRNEEKSLDDVCEMYNLDKEELINLMRSAMYYFDESLNQFRSL